MNPQVQKFQYKALAVLCAIQVSPCAAQEQVDDDLGFNTLHGGHSVGEISRKAFSHKDWDAKLIINNLPVSYGRPSTNEDLAVFEKRLNAALQTAERSNEAKGYTLLLEAGASFFQKRNEGRRA